MEFYLLQINGEKSLIHAYVVNKVPKKLQTGNEKGETDLVQRDILIGSDYYWDIIKET